MVTDGNGAPPPNEPNVNLNDLLSSSNNPIDGLPNNPVPPAADAGVPPAGVPSVIPPAVPPTGESSNAPTTGNQLETFEDLLPHLTSANPEGEAGTIKAALLSTFKANSVDANGNLLNDKNEIVLSANKVKAFLVEDAMPLDANGNMVDDKGTILRTKQELLSDNSIINPIINAIQTNFGIEFPQDVNFTEDEQGIVQLVDTAVKQKTANSVYEFLESNPDLKDYAQHLALGGTAENYSTNSVDYKNVQVKELSKEAKLNLLNKAFTAQGNPSKDTLINLIEKAGEEDLNKAVTDALSYLDTTQKQVTQQRQQQIQQQIEDEEQAVNKYWNDVNEVVAKGKLNHINIPLNDRQAFFNYMSKPVDANNNSADGLATQQDTLEFQLLVSYLRYKKGDISQLANIISKEDKVTSIIDRINKNKRLFSGNGVPATHNANGNTPKGGVSIEQLLG